MDGTGGHDGMTRERTTTRRTGRQKGVGGDDSIEVFFIAGLSEIRGGVEGMALGRGGCDAMEQFNDAGGVFCRDDLVQGVDVGGGGDVNADLFQEKGA